MEDIVIVSAARTAVGKFGGSLAKTPATELGSIVIKELLARSGLFRIVEAPGSFDERRELAIETEAPQVIERLKQVTRDDWDQSVALDLSDEGVLADLAKRHHDHQGIEILGPVGGAGGEHVAALDQQHQRYDDVADDEDGEGSDQHLQHQGFNAAMRRVRHGRTSVQTAGCG